MEHDSSSKILEYFKVIDWYVVDAIAKSSLKSSCIATILLIFAGIDGLGKLTHPNKNAKAGERFKFFISKLGDNYEKKKEKLWDLRNSLFHNALNVEVFLSMTELGQEHHLEEVDAPCKIYLNTNILYRDFCEAFSLEKNRIQNDEIASNQAADRLEWHYDDRLNSLNVPITPPPPIKFICSK